ncbi:hypothetical protein CISIN_1g036209mg [Citrus sinensis]|uniref:Uncharacterized protein n=1 Tax=Citrus sinensis TaxID=2711 RepID=A0A067DA98_CITSI|nr:hypothetical protein CISIN_1g036209mg [Citrus sinensis]
MKLSLKLPDDSQNPPILKVKIPITIFNQPFISSLTTTTTTTKTDSPLIFSAHFSLSYTNLTNFTPTFLLHFKPQFGNFSLHKTTSSSNPNPANFGPHLQSGSPSNTEFANRSISDESCRWQDLKLEPRIGHGNGSFFNGVDSIRSGIAVKARTVLPVTKRIMMNLRWGVNLPVDSEVKMPCLIVNKIGIERLRKWRK